MTKIRPERPDDAEAVAALTAAAFGGTDEVDLMDGLRADGAVITSLVADEYGEIVGHILFSSIEVADFNHNRHIRAAQLAPLSVAPTHQGLGIGSELVRQGIEKCKESGVELIAVLGHTGFYPRFGFSAELAECLKTPFSGPNFMVLPLKNGILDDFSGTAHYPPAFGA